MPSRITKTYFSKNNVVFSWHPFFSLNWGQKTMHIFESVHKTIDDFATQFECNVDQIYEQILTVPLGIKNYEKIGGSYFLQHPKNKEFMPISFEQVMSGFDEEHYGVPPIYELMDIDRRASSGLVYRVPVQNWLIDGEYPVIESEFKVSFQDIIKNSLKLGIVAMSHQEHGGGLYKRLNENHNFEPVPYAVTLENEIN